MPRYQQVFQFVGVILPFLGLPVAGLAAVGPRRLRHRPRDHGLALHRSPGLGIGVGYHRLLTHRAFETYRGLRYMWAILGSLALEGSRDPLGGAPPQAPRLLGRRRRSPHSPHGHGGGLRGTLRGLAHAHLGWVLFGSRQQDRDRYLGDLRDDRGMNLISDLFPLFAVLTFLIPGRARAGCSPNPGWAR